MLCIQAGPLEILLCLKHALHLPLDQAHQSTVESSANLNLLHPVNDAKILEQSPAIKLTRKVVLIAIPVIQVVMEAHKKFKLLERLTFKGFVKGCKLFLS